MGTPRDIAEGTVFLFSPAASYITGTTLVVDASQWRIGTVAGSNRYPDLANKLNAGDNKL